MILTFYNAKMDITLKEYIMIVCFHNRADVGDHIINQVPKIASVDVSDQMTHCDFTQN